MEHADGELQEIWPELEAVAAPARERRRLDPAVFADLVMALCNRAPLSVRDLSLLLARSEAYVGDAIRPLVASGRIRFLFPDQPKHPRQKYVAASAAAPAAEPAPIHVDEADDQQIIHATPMPRRSPAPPLEAPPLEAPPLEAPPLDAPSLDAPPLDAPPLDAPPSRDSEAPRAHALRSDAAYARARERDAVAARHHDDVAEAPATAQGWGSPRISVLAAVGIGIILAAAGIDRWVYYAAGAAAAFAVIHVVSRSRQYTLYLAQISARPSGPRSWDAAVFVLAKAAFSFAEIAVVVLIISLIRMVAS